MRSPRFRHDDGASLVIVLIFVAVFGLIVTALLTQAGASVAYTTVVRDHAKKVFAADAGISLGIQQLQQNNEICPETGSEETIHVINVNGLPVEVTCKVSSGSTIGALGYAIITLSPASDSLTVQSGQTKLVTGPVHVTGNVDFKKDLSVERGNFSQISGNGCTEVQPGNLTLEPGFGYFCKDSGPTLPTYDAPPMPEPAELAVSPPSNSCKFFYPGRYESKPALDVDRTNYFASGVYYFEFSDKFNIAGTGTKDMIVHGGEPADYEIPQYTAPACASDAAAVDAAGPSGAPEVTGTGVQFIFGGGASLEAGNKSQTELFVRTLDGTAQTSSPTILAVQPGWPVSDGWVANAQNTTVLGFAPGADKALLVHGLIFTPSQNVELWGTEAVDAAVFGGVIAWKIDLQASAAGNGITVSATDGNPDPRHIIITSTAPSPALPGQGKEVVSTAVVQIANDLNRTVTINSWRTRAPSEAL